MSTEPGGFDLDAHWSLHPQVALRPEPFGALLYHFGTRKLSFLKDPRLVDVVRALDSAPTARAACLRSGVPDSDLRVLHRSLATLASSTMITRSDT